MDTILVVMGCRVHDRVNEWAAPLSGPLIQRAQRTCEELRARICSQLGVDSGAWRVCVAGSVLNGTATACSSDLDLHVVLCDRFAYELPESPVFRAWVQMSLGHPIDCAFPESRRRVEAIVEHFYGDRTQRRSKAIHVGGDDWHLPADVVVGVEHRRFTGHIDGNGQPGYIEGVELRSREEPGTPVICFPELRRLALERHDLMSGGRSRPIIRILKCVRHTMRHSVVEALRVAAEHVPSCLIEALVAAAPAEQFRGTGTCFWDELDRVMPYLIELVSSPVSAAGLPDLGGVRPLFGVGQSWSSAQALQFLRVTWDSMRTHALPLTPLTS